MKIQIFRKRLEYKTAPTEQKYLPNKNLLQTDEKKNVQLIFPNR